MKVMPGTCKWCVFREGQHSSDCACLDMERARANGLPYSDAALREYVAFHPGSGFLTHPREWPA